MKLSRKLAVSAAAASIATATAVAPAMAETAPAAPKPTYEEQVQQAELTGKRIDNAKKGTETAKDIVDTLQGLNNLFGGGKSE